MLEIVTSCKALPDFDTLQIVYLNVSPFRYLGWIGGNVGVESQSRFIRENLRHWSDTGVVRLKQGKCGEGGGKTRKKTTLRLIELGSEYVTSIMLDSVGVEEYEVQ